MLHSVGFWFSLWDNTHKKYEGFGSSTVVVLSTQTILGDDGWMMAKGFVWARTFDFICDCYYCTWLLLLLDLQTCTVRKIENTGQSVEVFWMQNSLCGSKRRDGSFSCKNPNVQTIKNGKMCRYKAICLPNHRYSPVLYQSTIIKERIDSIIRWQPDKIGFTMSISKYYMCANASKLVLLLPALFTCLMSKDRVATCAASCQRIPPMH